MSAKTTGGRASLSLNSTGKMNHKTSTPNSVSDNNRGKELGNQKTEGEKSMKETQQSGKDKKSQSAAVSSSTEKKLQSTEPNPSSSSSSTKKSESSVAKNSSQIDEKKSQNGVNSSGNTKNQNSIKSDLSIENKQKQDKTVDKNKSQNIQQQHQQNSSSITPAEKSSEKVEANTDKKQDTSYQSDFEKTPRKNDARMAKSSSIHSPKAGSTAPNNDVETTKGKNVKDDDKKEIQPMTASQINAKKADADGQNASNENTNGTSTPTRNRRKAESTPDSKSKQSESVKAKVENKIVSPISGESESAKITVIDHDDVEMMDPLIFATDDFEPMAVAASTPGKIVKRKDGPPKSEQKTTSLFYNLPWSSPPERKEPNYTKFSISGRRSIHPTGSDYKSIQGNYRRTKTDLDISCNTNTSLNVTVGSEAANNSSFSFFSRKRDRTPANSRSELELMADIENSPKSPKRPRIDVSGLFSVVSSPLTMLRARFSRAAIQSSTPVKEDQDDDVNAGEMNEKSSNTSIDNDVQFNSDDDVTVGKEEIDEPKIAVVHPLTEGNKTEADGDGKIQEPKTEVDNEELPTSGTEQIPIAEVADEILVTITPNKKRANCNVM